jgi:hypothetical protein
LAKRVVWRLCPLCQKSKTLAQVISVTVRGRPEDSLNDAGAGWLNLPRKPAVSAEKETKERALSLAAHDEIKISLYSCDMKSIRQPIRSRLILAS